MFAKAITHRAPPRVQRGFPTQLLSGEKTRLLGLLKTSNMETRVFLSRSY